MLPGSRSEYQASSLENKAADFLEKNWTKGGLKCRHRCISIPGTRNRTKTTKILAIRA